MQCFGKPQQQAASLVWPSASLRCGSCIKPDPQRTVVSFIKVPISLSGLVLFDVPLSLPNLFSIHFGLFAGVVFARAKMS
ncbi:hypothetical protein DY000_02055024 [Brassica cretica]|uniref:Uncharacterized protein n=1 Tax=Brassica cretica TaxID=69181 RepID=A0ABQ7A7J4_BRACR|nr:hypothetical protein DY000_02055024 [Brassica cretica]